MLQLFVVGFLLGKLSFASVSADYILTRAAPHFRRDFPTTFVIVTSKEGKTQVVEDKALPLAEIFSSSKLTEVKSKLEKEKINLALVTHGLFNHEPVYIIGARPHDPKLPQIWIEKRHFLPVKIVTATHTFLFDHWTSLEKNLNLRFPQKIETIGGEAFTASIAEKLSAPATDAR